MTVTTKAPKENMVHVPEIPESPMQDVKPTRGRFTNSNVFNMLKEFYSEEQVKQMQDTGVDQRMMFGINPYYMALVRGQEHKDSTGKTVLPKMPASKPLEHLVIPIQAEAHDISGEKDPSNQQKYSPGTVKGSLLHKYDEIVLGYVALACSAHCRYCYRLDLFNGSTGKGLIKPEELRDYVKNYNENLKANNGCDPETGETRYPIREVLLSGGDPLVLTNKNLYKYMAAGAEGGATTIRLGTKEMAFRPMRFDANLVESLKEFHKNFPGVHVNIVVHFTHPDEFLFRDENNQYIAETHGYRWLDAVKEAVTNMASLPFVSLENQTPMIANVNDNEAALHLLHQELRRMNIKPKYIFQCREIEGHKAFAVPVEKAWRMHTNSQKGLSDTGRSRFSMSTEWGKMEVISAIDPLPQEALLAMPEEARRVIAPLFGEGLIFFKFHRSPFSAEAQGDIIIARRNPKALWISDYEDRILYDGRTPEKFSNILAIMSAIDQEGLMKFPAMRAPEEASDDIAGGMSEDRVQEEVSRLLEIAN